MTKFDKNFRGSYQVTDWVDGQLPAGFLPIRILAFGFLSFDYKPARILHVHNFCGLKSMGKWPGS